MLINILSIFPDYFDSAIQQSILGRALQAGKLEINLVNLRDFTTDKHQTTDDRPFGGGPGMVMKVEPIYQALAALELLPEQRTASQRVVLTSAKGALFTQQTAQEWQSLTSLTIICGHYEGVDERVAEHLVDSEVRIGDYVLTGGEPAALVMTDAVARLLPSVLGNEQSNQGESHSAPGVLGYPQYTRPEVFKGWKIPAVLLGGHHGQITAWREEHRSSGLVHSTESE